MTDRYLDNVMMSPPLPGLATGVDRSGELCMASGCAAGTDLVDVLDRVLDKGIVIDAWSRFSLVGLDLLTLQARAVVASVETYVQYSDALAVTS